MSARSHSTRPPFPIRISKKKKKKKRNNFTPFYSILFYCLLTVSRFILVATNNHHHTECLCTLTRRVDNSLRGCFIYFFFFLLFHFSHCLLSSCGSRSWTHFDVYSVGSLPSLKSHVFFFLFWKIKHMKHFFLFGDFSLEFSLFQLFTQLLMFCWAFSRNSLFNDIFFLFLRQSNASEILSNFFVIKGQKNFQ